MIKVLIIGPSRERTKGGMATVIQSQLDSNPNVYGFQLEHLVSHVDGNKKEKLFYFLKGIISFITKKHVGIVHIHVASDISFYRKSLFVYLSRLKRIPVIMHVHAFDFDSFYDRSPRLSKYFIRKTFRSCKKVLVLSSYWYEFFSKNICNTNLEILHNGVDDSFLKNCLAVSDTINRFLFLGRLGQRKGIYDLLEAINIIVKNQHYGNLIFYLAGDGDLQEVETIINTYQLTNHVHLLGWLDDKSKKEHLKTVYTVVLPSYNEGLPMSLLEAMACGKIIISTSVGGIPELIQEGDNGFLTKPGDIKGLVNNILHVVNHKEEMENISKNNIKKIQEKYNITTINKRLYEIYFEALSA